MLLVKKNVRFWLGKEKVIIFQFHFWESLTKIWLAVTLQHILMNEVAGVRRTCFIVQSCIIMTICI